MDHIDNYTLEELAEANKQIESTISKLSKSIESMEGKPDADRLKSQITLAKRRMKALEIAQGLILNELENEKDDSVSELTQYKEMHEVLKAEYDSVCSQMDELAAKDQTKKSTFKTLMARKLTLRELLDTYKKYGL